MTLISDNTLFLYQRRKASVVHIGDIPLGGNFPIRVQSMTNTPTLDTHATAEQCKRIIDAGADYVRITTPAVRDAENLAPIKKILREAGYLNPLVADVHFNPKVAEVAARIVEKVRINPGNYIDNKKFEHLEYSDEEYKLELERIHERVLPLLLICKEYGTAIRIGVNHGSLSDRIMSRYGDTPEGMAESAMEFLRIFESEGFTQTVLSMKSSNTRVMVQSTRLLVKKMSEEGMYYPLHLGVTEAGEGEDGIIKSSVGIGALLSEGIGDTIRVSLTGTPEQEIPVARTLVKYFELRQDHGEEPSADIVPSLQFAYHKVQTKTIENIGGKNIPIVIADWPGEQNIHKIIAPLIPDFYYFYDHGIRQSLPKQYKYITSMKSWFMNYKTEPNFYPLYTDAEFSFYREKSEQLNFALISATDLRPNLLDALRSSQRTILIIETFHKNGIAEQRNLISKLLDLGITAPMIINRNYCENDTSTFQIKSACDAGPLFIDGLGDGIWLRNANTIESVNLISASFGVLQASRVRTSKTEYISCPSCGRTLFDLTTTVAQIRSRTSHLTHLKIGVMGCIVNGPGEMADADYGYVGAGPGKITLYKNKEVIKRNLPEEHAVEELIKLIKENGDWHE
jgi:(E)-4-hydroxy-3-methylbut-2-enyl-diphosphate synthase